MGSIARFHGFSILKFIRYIKEELLIVLGTSSSESVLPRMMAKMENLGVKKSTVGLVIPTGYSFNLDGTSIYLTMAAVFIAQATNTPMTLTQQLTLLAVLLLTSKGAAGVTGSGFIVLAATLSAVGNVPVAGLALILGIDRFMSEARALTNLIGNGVATVVVGKWCGELDEKRMRRVLDNETDDEAEEPEKVLDAMEDHMGQGRVGDAEIRRAASDRSVGTRRGLSGGIDGEAMPHAADPGAASDRGRRRRRRRARARDAPRRQARQAQQGARHADRERAHAFLEAAPARTRRRQHGHRRLRDQLSRAVALALFPLPDR